MTVYSVNLEITNFGIITLFYSIEFIARIFNFHRKKNIRNQIKSEKSQYFQHQAILMINQNTYIKSKIIYTAFCYLPIKSTCKTRYTHTNFVNKDNVQ